MSMIASAPGKLILTGEYAVLDGADALVIAVTRRVTASHATTPTTPSAFLAAVASELEHRGLDAAAARARNIVVDSAPFYAGAHKLGLGSSAAVTVAATALALERTDRELVRAIAAAAHANAQGVRGARGSGADIAAAVYGGAIAFSVTSSPSPHHWPDLRIVPFFTGASADTATLVAAVAAARAERPSAVEAALVAIADASRTACLAVGDRDHVGLLAALGLAATAFDHLATATALPLVPPCVHAIRARLSSVGGVAKTTGAGGGDVAIAVAPITTDARDLCAAIVAGGGAPLDLAVDERGVDIAVATE